jgi:hypothetical protein
MISRPPPSGRIVTSSAISTRLTGDAIGWLITSRPTASDGWVAADTIGSS